MKKLALPLFLATFILFTACSKDDNDDPVALNATTLSGVWEMTEIETTNGKTTVVSLGQTNTIDFTSVGKDFETVLTLNEEGNTFTSQGSYTAVLTTTSAGGSNTEESAASFPSEGSWALDEQTNTLTFTINDVAFPYEVTSLTANEMTWRQEVNDTFELNDISTTVSATYTYGFRRQ